LSRAAQYGSFEQVEFLVNHKANISHANNHEVTPLMLACSNREDYARIVPFLIDKGASLFERDKDDRRPLEWAFEWGSTVLELIVPYYPRSSRGMSRACLMPCCADPARCLLVAIENGCLNLVTTRLMLCINSPAEEAWISNVIVGMNGKGDDIGVENQLPKTLADWRYAIAHFGSTRFIDTHDGTLLHAACEQNNLEVVNMIIARKAVNPYLRNRHYLTPDAFTKDPAIVSLVCDYRRMRPKPSLQHADWLGPYFVKKAMTLLLINQRLRLFPKDIVLYILGWIAHLDLY
jgi:ankyrin repeat protein